MNFNTDGFNETTKGYIKAMMQIAQRNAAPQVSKRPRYTIVRDDVVAVHAKGCVSEVERQKINEIIASVEAAPTMEEKAERVRQLPGSKVNFVNLKRATLNDHSRYPAEKLREIRAAGGGTKEQARAAKRAKPVKDDAPAFAVAA